MYLKQILISVITDTSKTGNLNLITIKIHTKKMFNDLIELKTKTFSSGLKKFQCVLLQEGNVLVYWLIIYFRQVVLILIVFSFTSYSLNVFAFIHSNYYIAIKWHSLIYSLISNRFYEFYCSKWSTFHCFPITRIKTTCIHVLAESQDHKLVVIMVFRLSDDAIGNIPKYFTLIDFNICFIWFMVLPIFNFLISIYLTTIKMIIYVITITYHSFTPMVYSMCKRVKIQSCFKIYDMILYDVKCHFNCFILIEKTNICHYLHFN